MGIIEKIRKIFEKEPEIEIHEIEEDEIENEIGSIKKYIDKEIEDSVEHFYKDLFPILDSLEEKSKDLEKVDISKRKVHERIRNITQVGREEYLQEINSLIKNLRYKNKENFIQHITKTITDFEKRERKAELKASQIIGKEIEEIKKDLSHLRRNLNEFFEENSENLEKLDIIKSLRNNLKNKQELEKSLEEINIEITKLKGKDEKGKEEIKELENKAVSLKNSQEYKEYEVKMDNFQEIKRNLDKISTEIKILLDEKVFFKYFREEKDERKKDFIENYLKNKLDSFLEDENLQILDVLSKIEEENKLGNLNFKESESEKINSARLNLKGLKEKYSSTKNKLNEIKKHLEENKILDKINDLERKKKQIEEEIAENTRSKERLNVKQEEIQRKLQDLKPNVDDKLEKLNIRLKNR